MSRYRSSGGRMAAIKSETVEVLSRTNGPASLWQPVEGEEALAFREHLEREYHIPQHDRDVVIHEAVKVLSGCLPPFAGSGRRTGLVVGYVQSGKTMSFTAIAALARDNGYKLVIVISGLTRYLFDQSSKRLERDLRIAGARARQWQFYANPRPRPENKQSIATAARAKSSLPGLSPQTVLITVMKQGTHLDHLIKLLSGLDLVNTPTIVIDDEADQASLNNNVRKGGESPTYRRILELRQLLPHHTFVQYTATPQALLLINLIDVLSPEFSELLTPGPTYTGGKTFFESDFKLVRPIPLDDIPTKSNSVLHPPASLIEALQIFFLGVAVELKEHGNTVGHRSMMVHPSEKRIEHADFEHWIRNICADWKAVLLLPPSDRDQLGLLAEFQAAYNDLKATSSGIAPFEALIPFLSSAIVTTVILVANAAQGKTPPVEWDRNYSYILVGGNMLNRGYTVEGLTVTYMPRSRGVGNADTIEQRARWFGYKAGYLGLCRVYLSDHTLAAYRSYVVHEENVREQLRKHRATGASLQDWRRAFFLSDDLRPTRSNVLDLDYVRGNFSSSWFRPSAPHYSIAELQGYVAFAPDGGNDLRTPAQRHLVANDISLQLIFERFLTAFQMAHPGDSQRFTGLLLQLSASLEQDPNQTCSIYLMSSGRPRYRSLTVDGEVAKLFEGAHPDAPQHLVGSIYPGDQGTRASVGATIQIHTLDIGSSKGGPRQLLASQVPAMAVWLPRSMSQPWLVQDQGGQLVPIHD
jgi:hypothetical protein